MLHNFRNELIDIGLILYPVEALRQQYALDNGFESLYFRDDTELDRDVDITDFNLLGANFAPAGYATSAIPEPSTISSCTTLFEQTRARPDDRNRGIGMTWRVSVAFDPAQAEATF